MRSRLFDGQNIKSISLEEHTLSYYTMIDDLFNKCRALAEDESIVAKV